MKASLDQRIDSQVKCDRSIQLAQLSGSCTVKKTTTTTKIKAQKDATEPFRRCQTESKKPNLSLKAELLSLTEHLQRNPTYEKGEGRPLPARGAPLTKLTTIELSRKKKSGVFRPKVCGKYALQGSSRALFTPFDPTHKECT